MPARPRAVNSSAAGYHRRVHRSLDLTAAPTLWRPPAGSRWLALSPAGTKVAVLGDDALAVHDLDRGELMGRAPAGPDTLAAAVADDGTLALVDGSASVRVALADGREGPRLGPMSCGLRATRSIQGCGPATETLSVAPADLLFTADGRALLVSSRGLDDEEAYYGGGWIEGRARALLWRWPSGALDLVAEDRVMEAITYGPRDAEVAADHVVACASAPPRLAALLRSGRVVLPGTSGPTLVGVRGLVFLPGGARLVVARAGELQIYDLAEGRLCATFPAPPGLVALAAAPDGMRVAGVDEGRLVLAELGDGRWTSPPHEGVACEPRWSPSGLALRREDGAVLRWR